MRYVPIKLLKTGMTLGRDVYDGAGRMLLATHLQLNEGYIKDLENLGFPGVYIDDEFSEGIEIREVIRPEVKREALGLISKVFMPDGEDNVSGQDIRRMVENVVDNVLDNGDVMCNMLDIKNYDDYTYFHSVNVGILSAMVGIDMEMEREELIELTTAGMLHDIGKRFISVEILNSPEKLDDDQMKIMQEHSRKGADFLRDKYNFPSNVNQGVLQHHEWYNGEGYPLGRYGEEIPMIARIISLIDVYDALTSNRPYRDALPNSEAVEYLMGNAGRQFDPNVVEAFLHKVAIYPEGSQVELSDGRRAIVVENSPEVPLRPLLRDIDTKETIDLTFDYNCRNVTITKIII